MDKPILTREGSFPKKISYIIKLKLITHSIYDEKNKKISKVVIFPSIDSLNYCNYIKKIYENDPTMEEVEIDLYEIIKLYYEETLNIDIVFIADLFEKLIYEKNKYDFDEYLRLNVNHIFVQQNYKPLIILLIIFDYLGCDKIIETLVDNIRWQCRYQTNNFDFMNNFIDAFPSTYNPLLEYIKELIRHQGMPNELKYVSRRGGNYFKNKYIQFILG
jgi:hypothetical protein